MDDWWHVEAYQGVAVTEHDRNQQDRTAARMYHAEHVGSLLRPAELLDARRDFADGKINRDELRAAEERAALANLHRCLKPGGVLVMTVPFALLSPTHLVRAMAARCD